jgi:hypothetical protein
MKTFSQFRRQAGATPCRGGGASRLISWASGRRTGGLLRLAVRGPAKGPDGERPEWGEFGGTMSRKLLMRALGVLTAVALPVFAATPALAYGAENWQVAFAGTGVAPGTGQGSGFWGWCAFGGGVTFGTDGDCETSQYFHAPSGGGFTCEVSIDITAWDRSGGTFVASGTATARPASVASECLAFFPGSANFTGLDSGIPAAPGHYSLGGLGPGLRGEFQIQVTQVR